MRHAVTPHIQTMEEIMMTMRKTILQTVGAGALIALCAGSAQANLLADPGFDLVDATVNDSAPTGWSTFNGAVATNPASGATSPVADSPDNSLKLFNSGGAFQIINNVAPGTLFDASGVGMNFSGDPLLTTTETLLQVVFRNAGGQYAGTAANGNFALNFNVFESNRITSNTTSDVWTLMDFTGGAPILAPDDTAYLEFFVLQVNNAGGAGFIDSVSLTAVPVPAAVWLFGSGLIGLVGVARRRKAQA